MGNHKWSDAELSAYLDGQLSPNQERALESVLQNDQVLQARLEGMKAVVALVRAMPVREAPRNYLLTPSMVAEKSKQTKGRRHYQAPLLMRLATSLTAAAFVVTMGLNVFLSSPKSAPFAQMASPAMESYAEPEMLMAEATMEAAAAELEEPRAMIVAKESEAEKEVAAVTVTEEIEEAAISEDADNVGENGELLIEEGIGMGGGAEPGLGAATTLPEEDDAESAEIPIQEPDNSITSDIAMTEEPTDTDSSAEPQVDMLTTSIPPVVEETLALSPEEPPMNPGRNPRGMLFSAWLPWTLGGATFLLGLATWYAGRRRR